MPDDAPVIRAVPLWRDVFIWMVPGVGGCRVRNAM
jgi:hypothetical protein